MNGSPCYRKSELRQWPLLKAILKHMILAKVSLIQSTCPNSNNIAVEDIINYIATERPDDCFATLSAKAALCGPVTIQISAYLL